MTNKKIFVACDTSKVSQVKKIINQTNSKILNIIPKFGLQFFYSKDGRKYLEKFKKEFWLDLKINDIPQTALSAIDSLKDLKKCRYITVHASGGFKMNCFFFWRIYFFSSFGISGDPSFLSIG